MRRRRASVLTNARCAFPKRFLQSPLFTLSRRVALILPDSSRRLRRRSNITNHPPRFGEDVKKDVRQRRGGLRDALGGSPAVPKWTRSTSSRRRSRPARTRATVRPRLRRRRRCRRRRLPRPPPPPPPQPCSPPPPALPPPGPGRASHHLSARADSARSDLPLRTLRLRGARDHGARAGPRVPPGRAAGHSCVAALRGPALRLRRAQRALSLARSHGRALLASRRGRAGPDPVRVRGARAAGGRRAHARAGLRGACERSVTARSSARGLRLCAPIHGHAHAPVALRQLTPQRLHRMLRASQDRALQVAFEELGSRLEGKLGALVASGEHDWLEDEDSALYFELETLPGYSCNVSGASGCAALAAASAARWWRR